MTTSITQAKLKYYLTYNKFDGVFTWNDDFASRARKGQRAGCHKKYNGEGVNGVLSSNHNPSLCIDRKLYSVANLHGCTSMDITLRCT